MSALKPFVNLASCRSYRRIVNTTTFRARSSLPYVKCAKQCRRPFASARNASHPSKSTDRQRQILIAVQTLFLLGLVYKHLESEFKHPLALDTYDAYERSDHDPTKYRPFFRTPTIEEVNETLRWEESSKLLGSPSDILRYDSVKVPSNSPCEDVLITAMCSDSDDPNAVNENLQWAIWGVCDGHE